MAPPANSWSRDDSGPQYRSLSERLSAIEDLIEELRDALEAVDPDANPNRIFLVTEDSE